jgi:hypothetical protein
MSRMNGQGPEEKGAGTGRKLGKCSVDSKEKSVEQLGRGMGLRRKQVGGKGQGKRLRSGENN